MNMRVCLKLSLFNMCVEVCVTVFSCTCLCILVHVHFVGVRFMRRGVYVCMQLGCSGEGACWWVVYYAVGAGDLGS